MVMTAKNLHTFGESPAVDFELKSTDPTFLSGNPVCKVAGQQVDRLTDVDVRVNVGEVADVTLRLNAWSGLDMKFPAQVAVEIVAYQPDYELIEEPIADGGRRFYVRHRE